MDENLYFNQSNLIMDKKAAIRRQVIDRMMCNRFAPFPTKEELRQECAERLYGSRIGAKPSTSTIEKDVKYMQDVYGAPLKWNAQEKGYHYTEKGFSIGLTDDEYESIHMASRVLDQFKDTEIFEDFDNVVEKLLERVELSQYKFNKDSREYVQFETAPVVVGTEYLSPILGAIRNKQKISIEYKKFNTEQVKTHFLDPYLLKEYRNRWYVIGYKQDSDYIFTFGLDRIESLIVLPDKFNISERFNLYKFYQHNVGITTIKEKPQKVVLEVSIIQSEYLISQPLHISQKELSRDKDKVTFELNVVATYELERLILGMGDQVKVLEPNSIIKKLKTSLKNSLKRYE